ncbi:hypothetical protein COO05_26355 [Bacillus toyonensis]|uniref:hypothetical protein n=1 Tax=Bacillus cereus group TaxID=86661 RepID=UPI000BEC2996|nr:MULTISPECIES: hypothetical protein [Bacillus cereus group]MEC3158403.1 hypothetical protein [Bacillus thuringiensis]PEB21654.1 hypothetical protein COO05_26355 [Bacillus toyonensis]
MKEQIKELKIELGNLINWSWILGKTCDSEEDFKRLQETDKRIDELRPELFQLTGDYKYATVKEVVKKYRRGYWDFDEYGTISLSELYKHKQAKIEIIKNIHKQNGVADITVDMKNINHFYVEKKEVESYLKNQRDKTKSPNRRKRQFDMMMYEMWVYMYYFNNYDRFGEVRDLVRQVFGPDKKAMKAELNEIKKVIKLTNLLRDQL